MFGINLDLPNEFACPAARDKSAVEMGQLEGRFLKIALRISMYPIALILVNIIITVGDLYLSAHGGVENRADYVLYCVYYFFYGARGIVFAALSIFVDPCIRKGLAGVRTLSGRGPAVLPTYDDPHSTKRTKPSVKQDFSEMLSASTPVLEYAFHLSPLAGDSDTSGDVRLYTRPRLDSKVSLEMSQTLSALPLEAHHVSLAPPRRPSAPSQGRPKWTRSFSGVPIGALPVELQDDEDIDIRREEAKRGNGDGHRLRTSSVDRHESHMGAAGEGRSDEGGTLGQQLDPLSPYIPDAKDERERRLKAALFSREEAIRLFKETEAQL